MALNKTNDTDEELALQINNGDLTALNDIIRDWGFKDKESALRFAIAVLKVTSPGKLYQEKENGHKATLITY